LPEEGRYVCEDGDDFEASRLLSHRQAQGESILPNTQLRQFFKQMNLILAQDPNAMEAELTYIDWPQFYRWDKQHKIWVIRPHRSQNTPKRIVRLGMVSSKKPELLVMIIKNTQYIKL
jgi:hypothetical protein